MKRLLFIFNAALLIAGVSCTSNKDNKDKETVDTNSADKVFSKFEDIFLDAYWNEYPSGSITAGYNKYYEKLVIPNKEAFDHSAAFSKQWLDSLNALDFKSLEPNNKISFNIIKNQLESDLWYVSVFKLQEWNASIYNISGDCDYILNQPYAPLDDRLKILSKHIEHSDEYYKAALASLTNPTKEHLELAIKQNLGGLSLFGTSLTDSINASHLSDTEKASLQQNIDKTKKAINGFVASLKSIYTDKKHAFKDFRIGKEMFDQKFKYDLATDLTPEQVYENAKTDKQVYHQKMIEIANSLWPKYYSSQNKPEDNMKMIQMVLDKIQRQHATPSSFFDSLTSQVYRLKKFIIEKNLFDFDTVSPPIQVRYMPEYERGFSVASAEFTPPYQKSGTTFYNIDDLKTYTPEKAEGVLKEYNNYSSQLLSIHEAVPGHCVQGIYNNKKSPDVVRSVFQNGAMIEGWAVYAESMMLENGWGNNSPEMELVHDKLKLRELANVLIDYELQTKNASRESLVNLMVNECFQTPAQAEEKYHRATVSQVQLCSYYSGSTAILALREDYKKKMGDKYSLKEFHEKFLSYGSSPVKYIRERMLE